MKILAKTSLLALGLAAVSVPAFSAAAEATAPAPTERHAKVAEHLDLTDQQKTQLKAQRAELKSSLAAVKSDASLTAEQKRAKARELTDAARGQMRSVLTPDQQTKFDKMHSKTDAHHHGKRKR